MRRIYDKSFGEERALYALRDAVVEKCRFEGEEDGESAMKECENISVKDCFMDLRYPLWHNSDLKIFGGEMTVNCRAALWYDRNTYVEDCKLHGIKALRECKDSHFKNCDIVSPEFGWQSDGIKIENCFVQSEYAFLHSSRLNFDGLELKGKYTFQYTKDVKIKNSKLFTKDAFWHAENVTVEDSILEGEYLGWYSDNLTLVRCRIKGTQPLCYCKNLKLVDCTTEDCDLSFEYSDVEASIVGNIISVKNPRSGRITADSVGEIIRTSDSVYPSTAEVTIRSEKRSHKKM